MYSAVQLFHLHHLPSDTFFCVCVGLKSPMGSVFQCFFTVLCCVCLFPASISAPGRGGEGHEGEDAQERREVVVLLARQEQQRQICKFAHSRDASYLSCREF